MAIETVTTHIKKTDMHPFFSNNTEIEGVQSFKPCIRQHWLWLVISAVSVLLAFAKFDIKTVTGLCILSLSCLLIVYIILSIYTTKYVITRQGVLIKKGPFSRKFRELAYGDINNISIMQGAMQKRLKIGNLIIMTHQITCTIKGIKKPNQIKERINKEKAAEYERRTLLRKIL